MGSTIVLDDSIIGRAQKWKGTEKRGDIIIKKSTYREHQYKPQRGHSPWQSTVIFWDNGTRLATLEINTASGSWYDRPGGYQGDWGLRISARNPRILASEKEWMKSGFSWRALDEIGQQSGRNYLYARNLPQKYLVIKQFLLSKLESKVPIEYSGCDAKKKKELLKRLSKGSPWD